ncbi:MAG: GNAT family N-acetyltransferase [Lachnospiraceae bacterium]|nr:GNAT family N-acetyltransferase [Lachnospiraceae bacterium]
MRKSIVSNENKRLVVDRLMLRPYKACDAKKIVTWCNDEVSFRKWSSDRFETFPITEADMNKKYIDNNGDCIDEDNFYPMTAVDNGEIVGHLIMRFTDEDKTVLRFGFVIVDNLKRGMGYGKEMLELALKYAFEFLKVEKVTLGVFDNNMPAYYCYKAVGFKDISMKEKECFSVCGEVWNLLELEIEKSDYKSCSIELLKQKGFITR